MAGLEIMNQGRDGQTVALVEVLMTVDAEIDNGQEGVGVYILFLAHFFDGLVAKTQVDAETAKALQNAIVVGNERDHLVACLIHLLILHLVRYLIYIYKQFAKLSIFLEKSNHHF